MLAGLFLAAHGLIHLALWLPAPAPTAPFDPRRSWALPASSDAAGASVTLAALAAALYVAAGTATVLDLAVSGAVAVTAALAALVLKAVWFHPWLLLGVAIDLAVLVAAVT